MNTSSRGESIDLLRRSCDKVHDVFVVHFVGLREKNVVKNRITHDDYKNCLLNREEQMKKMNVIRSHLHDLYTEEVNKVALSAEDDKRVIMEDGIHTLAYGHHRLIN